MLGKDHRLDFYRHSPNSYHETSITRVSGVHTVLILQGGSRGHAAMSPAISCSNPGSQQNPVRTPRNPVPTPPKTVQKNNLLMIIDSKKKKIQKCKRAGIGNIILLALR